MNIISVCDRNGILVVDSRLIAQRLGIEHETLMKTIKKYQSKIESRFGQIRFEVGTVKNSVGAVNEVKYCMLTESQATVLMTFSRNTDEVVECKLDLVDAFEKAKTLLQDPTIALYQRHHEQCHQQFLADSHRIELRNQLKDYRKNLNATIKSHFDRLDKVTPRDIYWKVADGLNIALTSETAKQMRSRTGLDSSQLIGDYMAERPLWFYTLAITVTTNLILCDRLPPLEAIKKAPELALPKDYNPEQIELVDPVKALEKRIDLYLSGQLTLPIPNSKVLAIA